MVMLISVFCGCVSDSGTTVSKGNNSNNVSSTNSQKDKNESSNTASADMSSDVSGDSSETSGDNSNEASGDGLGDTSSDLSNETSGNGAENGSGTESGTGNGTENGTGNGNGTENGTGTEEENEPVPPVIDPDYIENPTDADIELFYNFIDRGTTYFYGEGLYWPGSDDIDFGNYNKTLWLAMEYYTYFGFKTERLESEGKGCGDPLNRFIFPDEHYDPLIGTYVYADVYDVEALNWICENVFNNTAVYPDDKVGYCHEGKFYDAYYVYGASGYPGDTLFECKKSYKYLGNGQYRFTFYYDMAVPDVGDRTTMSFIAIPKHDEKMGTYWKLISYDRVKREQYEIVWDW